MSRTRSSQSFPFGRLRLSAPEYLEQRLPLAAWLGFEEVAATANLGGDNESFGIAWGDANGDRFPDLWRTNHTQPSTLHLGDGQGGFVLAGWQPSTTRDKHGVLFADLDGDGNEDVIELVGGDGNNYIYYNDGDSFQEDANTPLTYRDGRGRTPLVADINLDGRLDVVVTNVKRTDGLGPTAIFLQDEFGTFSLAGPEFELDVDSAQTAHLADMTGDGIPELVFPSFPFRAFEISASGLTPVTGLGISGLTQGDVAIADFNGDGLNDLISLDWRLSEHEQAALFNGDLQVSASMNQGALQREVLFSTSTDQITIEIGPDRVLGLPPDEPLVAGPGVVIESVESIVRHRVRGFRRFVVSASASTTSSASGPGVSVSRDDSGKWSFKLERESGVPPILGRINATISADGLAVDSVTGFETAPFSSRVFLGGQNGFHEVDPLPIVSAGHCESLAAADVDNDRDLDLYIVCSGAAANAPNALLLNDGSGNFTIAPAAAGATGNVQGRGKSVASADYDLDGHLDFVVGNGAGGAINNLGPTLLFRNLGSDNHWIEIDLDGWGANRNGIGATVAISAGDDVQSHTVGANVHRFTANHRRLHFGLGQHHTVDSISIKWPDGTQTDYDGPIAADRLLTLRPPELAVFAAAKSDGQMELFASDGTTARTSLLRNLGGSTSTDPTELTLVDFAEVGPRIMFGATGGDGQTELAISDGTAVGTKRLRGLGGDLSANPHELTPVDVAGGGQALFFAATRFNGQVELFRSDGTKDGTGIVRDLGGSTSSDPRNFVSMDGVLYFTAVGAAGERELYRSDGTFDGTLLVLDIGVGTSSDPQHLTPVMLKDGTQRLFFSATGDDGQIELYVSDGTAEGTERVRDLSGGVSAAPSELVAMLGEVYFVATMDDGEQRELYKSDGTSAGTVRVKNLSEDINSSPHELTVAHLAKLGPRLFFGATGQDGEVELVMSDGTFHGTSRVRDLGTSTSAEPAELTEFGGEVYFAATRANGQRELHKTDGTRDGTDLVENLSGALSANPKDLSVINWPGHAGGMLVFSAVNADGQVELFRSDGTEDGTFELKDISGTQSSHPAQITPLVISMDNPAPSTPSHTTQSDGATVPPPLILRGHESVHAAMTVDDIFSRHQSWKTSEPFAETVRLEAAQSSTRSRVALSRLSRGRPAVAIEPTQETHCDVVGKAAETLGGLLL